MLKALVWVRWGAREEYHAPLLVWKGLSSCSVEDKLQEAIQCLVTFLLKDEQREAKRSLSHPAFQHHTYKYFQAGHTFYQFMAYFSWGRGVFSPSLKFISHNENNLGKNQLIPGTGMHSLYTWLHLIYMHLVIYKYYLQLSNEGNEGQKA